MLNENEIDGVTIANIDKDNINMLLNNKVKLIIQFDGLKKKILQKNDLIESAQRAGEQLNDVSSNSNDHTPDLDESTNDSIRISKKLIILIMIS